jgi:hypothetical protein
VSEFLPFLASMVGSIIRDTPQSRQCCRRCPPVKDKSCVGKEENFAGLVSYITGSPSASEAVLFASDIFGNLTWF